MVFSLFLWQFYTLLDGKVSLLSLSNLDFLINTIGLAMRGVPQGIAYSIYVKAACLLSFKDTKTKDLKTKHTARLKLFIGIDIHKRSRKIYC